ncbi:muconolactone delta-isomerase [Actinomadura sp. LD22]|uniref:Muconolactone Delta-isomerase n=1 Tax=Actinomadura physcomitrii TaxID=2650748 RepID=A0A6I4MN93_9ACTN|nr:muconolactone Delta-isomerase family protein [Actinomadura physcomitrii]MWA04921.1 muconolactone delta-isomerase [Actinomadura physcomitrii]
MPEFLVRIAVTRPASFDDDRWREVLAAEADVATGYREAGLITRIWRLPGTTANVGVWQAADATELHEHLSRLPAFPYMDVQVEALALHYLESSGPG